MIAGRLTHPAVVYKQVRTTSATTGTTARSYVKVYPRVMLERVRLSARQVHAAAEVTEELSVQWRCWDAYKIESKMRIEADGETFDVVSVEPDRQNRLLLLNTKRINR